jgi:hypothetical protein
MNLAAYKYKTNQGLLDYEFYSDGPKGKIKKVVRFTPRNANGVTYFNLGFGDWNEKKRTIDDLIVTDNRDKHKILATVAATVLEFTGYFPDAWIYAQGSTPARTRLYQMGLNAHWNDIELLLHVYGFVRGKWLPFQNAVNYEAFIVLRKNQ